MLVVQAVVAEVSLPSLPGNTSTQEPQALPVAQDLQLRQGTQAVEVEAQVV
jgi:hypothetical protein